MPLLAALRTLWAYAAHRHAHFNCRGDLEAHQTVLLQQHLHWLRRNSPHFRDQVPPPAGGSPWAELQRLPVVNKDGWMQSFEASNTRGLSRSGVEAAALKAAREPGTLPLVNGCAVGLSSGTAGVRSIFVLSPSEQARWLGTLLAGLFPQGLLSPQRIAVFDQAGHYPHMTGELPWLKYRFFDLRHSFATHLVGLSAFRPALVIAPSQVLRAIALGRAAGVWRGAVAVSTSEVLDPATRRLLCERFAGVKEVYQAAEGLLATTCEHGSLHLNEENVIFEREWLDRDRFVPVITDLRRRVQPVVRYRLDDVLRVDRAGCPCGRHSTVIAAIEGRQDDQLVLPGRDGEPVPVFAGPISGAIAQVLPLQADYQLTQDGEADLVFETTAGAYEALKVNQALNALFEEYGVNTALLRWQLEPERDSPWEPLVKRRRVQNVYSKG